MQSRMMRWVVTVLGAGLVAAGVLWLLAPARTCVVLGDPNAGFVCPNRFGFSLAPPATLVIALALGLLAGFGVWRTGARRITPGSQ